METRRSFRVMLAHSVTPLHGTELLIFTIFPSSAMILLVVWSANGEGSALISKASSNVNLLNYDTYQWYCDRNCVIIQTN